MRYYNYILILLVSFIFSACGTSKRVPTTTVLQTKRITELVPVLVPDRSGVLRAQLECDSLNRVQIAWFEQQADRGGAVNFSLDANGLLDVKMYFITDTLYVPSTYDYAEVPVLIPHLVEKELSKWQRTQIQFGRLTIIAAFGYVLLKVKFKGVSLLKNLLNIISKLFK